MLPLKRYLAIWCPQLPLDRWLRREDPRLSGPFAVIHRDGNAERVLVPNPPARTAGVSAGQSLTNAYAVCPDLMVEPQDEVREARLLGALHTWSDRFSPSVATMPPDGLLLDVSGCAHLFGGEYDLANAIRDGLDELRITPRIGLANTTLAAQGFARFGDQQIVITNANTEHSAVGGLPIGALRLKSDASTTLRRVGVTTVADLAKFKSSELARRFGVGVPDALDRLKGQRSAPLVPSATRRIISASRNLSEPVSHLEAVMAILEQLTERVCRDLLAAGKAARGFRLTVTCPDTGAHDLDIGFASPCREVAPILRQFERPLDGLKLPFGADSLRLRALDEGIFAHTQADLSDESARQYASVEQTLTTLGNRLGFDRLRQPVTGQGHAPEDEHCTREVMDAQITPTGKVAAPLSYHPRPERVWSPERVRVEVPGNPPLRFTWKSQTHVTVDSDGPERVSPVWWKDDHNSLTSQTRDYMRVKTEDGRCFWMMTFAGKSGPRGPEWFCCGEFLIAPRVRLASA